MRIYAGSREFSAADRGCVLTIGSFDGVHVGHQALVRSVVERAAELGRRAAVYTFDPHPRRVLSPEHDQPLLMTWPQLELEMEALGIDCLVREAFTADFSSLTPEAFLREIIHDRIHPAELFVGRDFHFGKGRGGSGETLAQIGPGFGIRVEIMPQVCSGGRDVSSTRVREGLRVGDVKEALSCLGRPYQMWGRVVHGDHRGRELGFPTANLDPENEIVPRNGVYATSVRLFEGGRPSGPALPSVTNIGTRPTFEQGRVLVESHLIDFDGDLYGQRIALTFHARIRDERRFSGPDELVRQIGKDTEQTRALLGSPTT